MFAKALAAAPSSRGDVSELRCDDEVQILSFWQTPMETKLLHLSKTLCVEARRVWAEIYGVPRTSSAHSTTRSFTGAS
eukprot:4899952-Amphidinium_carterae.1